MPLASPFPFVPEGLPLALTVGLTFIARRLCSEHFVLVKRLGTIETLGSISLLASDKTGTLTQNKMTVTNVILASMLHDSCDVITTGGEAASEIVVTDESNVGLVCTLCNQSVLESSSDEDKSDKRVAIGSNATDRALLNWAEQQGVASHILAEFQVLTLLPFSSATKLTAVVVLSKTTNERFVLIKGAPEYILPLCDNFVNSEKAAVIITDSFTKNLFERVDGDATKGRRVIGLAMLGPLDTTQFPTSYSFTVDPKPNFPMEKFTFVACVSVSDPPREGVKEAVLELRGAGIKVAMVTGDAPNTALAIARSVGIVSNEGPVDSILDVLGTDFALESHEPEVASLSSKKAVEMSLMQKTQPKSSTIVVSGNDLYEVSGAQWDYMLAHQECVFARTTPEQKLQIVKESQKRGYRVAVTGDGVNDSPAIKRADIGIAMNSDSDVSKDVAAMVLLRDDFTAIPKGVREGRLIFENLRKVIAYQMSAGSWCEVLPVLATFFLGMPTPLSSFLMIMICCFSDVFAGIALMTEPPETNIMKQRPRDIKNSRLLDFNLILYSYFFYGNLMAIGAFYNYFHYMYYRGPHVVANPIPADDDGTLTFPAGYTTGQLLFAWNWGVNSNNLGTDESAAANVGSSVFYVTLVAGQMGHLLSIRRKLPYFYDAIMATDGDSSHVAVRLWKEVAAIKIRWPILAAWIGAVCTTFIVNNIDFFNTVCSTGVVPGTYWGIAIGWSLLWFVIGEIRKWIFVLFPDSSIAKTTW